MLDVVSGHITWSLDEFGRFCGSSRLMFQQRVKILQSLMV